MKRRSGLLLLTARESNKPDRHFDKRIVVIQLE